MSDRKKPSGRPKGAKNYAKRGLPEVETISSECPKCRSTEVGPQLGKTLEQRYLTKLPDGRVFTHIIRRRFRCVGCGQVRIVRTLENRK